MRIQKRTTTSDSNNCKWNHTNEANATEKFPRQIKILTSLSLCVWIFCSFPGCSHQKTSKTIVSWNEYWMCMQTFYEILGSSSIFVLTIHSPFPPFFPSTHFNLKGKTDETTIAKHRFPLHPKWNSASTYVRCIFAVCVLIVMLIVHSVLNLVVVAVVVSFVVHDVIRWHKHMCMERIVPQKKKWKCQGSQNALREKRGKNNTWRKEKGISKRFRTHTHT